MAVQYWPYWQDVTTSTTGGTSNWTFSQTSATTTVYQNFLNPLVYYSYQQTVRDYLIEAPAHWTKRECADFTKLINDDTNTGFKVQMWIRGGDIDITDMDVEERTMKEFYPLLFCRANVADQKKIGEWFAANLEPKP